MKHGSLASVLFAVDRYPVGVYNRDIKKKEQMTMDNNCCCQKTRERSDEEYKRLANRLSRIEGQVKGIRVMLDKSAYCPDILIQVSAATAALNSFAKELLSQHIKTCVVRDIEAGKAEETVDELLNTLQKLMR